MSLNPDTSSSSGSPESNRESDDHSLDFQLPLSAKDLQYKDGKTHGFMNPLLLTAFIEFQDAGQPTLTSYECAPIDFTSFCSCDDMAKASQTTSPGNSISFTNQTLSLRLFCNTYYEAVSVTCDLDRGAELWNDLEKPSTADVLTLMNQLISMCRCRSLRMFTNLRMKKSIRSPIHSDKDGMVYVLSQGMLGSDFKIGFSRGHRQLRQRISIQRQCFPDATLIAHTTWIEHAYRVEKLSHLQLNLYRAKEQCEKCKQIHTEWFRVPKTIALEAVTRWANWMSYVPYDTDTLDLKREWARRLWLTSDFPSLHNPGSDSLTWDDWARGITRQNPMGMVHSKGEDNGRLQRYDGDVD